MMCWLVLNMLSLQFEAKCKILHLDQENPKHKYELGKECLESSCGEEDLGMLDKKPNATKKCHLLLKETKAS